MDRASHALGAVSIGVIRLLGGALVLGVYWWVKRERVRIRRVDWWHIFVVAALANALPFVIQPYAMIQAGEHGYFGMMVALVPLATILASIPMLKIWPSRRQLVGVLGGIVCMGVGGARWLGAGDVGRFVGVGADGAGELCGGERLCKMEVGSYALVADDDAFFGVGGCDVAAVAVFARDFAAVAVGRSCGAV